MAYHSSCSVVVPCLAFVDDCLIFFNGRKSSIGKVTRFLEHSQNLSGQIVNKEKSTCILSTKLTNSRVNKIMRYTGFRKENLPFVYLVVLVFKGKKQRFLFDALIEKLKKMIDSWDNIFLSYGGKITLLQSILTAMPLYYLKSKRMSDQVRNKIESIMNRTLEEVHTTCMMKTWFRLREGKSLLSKYMLAKYFKMRHPTLATVHLAHSRLWKNLMAIGDGSCDFWKDSWLPAEPLDSNVAGYTKISEFWINEQ
ncbi:hypothetical protein Leryth_026208 [Lithospermum erythrorhizon]|nr:hypothetical protein Leryth_026208 [Lithospermum erythrorhizon]